MGITSFRCVPVPVIMGSSRDYLKLRELLNLCYMAYTFNICPACETTVKRCNEFRRKENLGEIVKHYRQYRSVDCITYASIFWHPIPSKWNIYDISSIGKTPVRIILWCPTTKMLIKTCFLIHPLEQEGGCQKCSISLCSKVFINHFSNKSPECLSILTYWSKYWVDRLRNTLRRKV